VNDHFSEWITDDSSMTEWKNRCSVDTTIRWIVSIVTYFVGFELFAVQYWTIGDSQTSTFEKGSLYLSVSVGIELLFYMIVNMWYLCVTGKPLWAVFAHITQMKGNSIGNIGFMMAFVVCIGVTAYSPYEN